MRSDLAEPLGWARSLALVAIALLGLATIVGSGGGGIAFVPSDCPSNLDCSAPPPTAAVSVQPPYVTALVGAPVTYSAETTDASGAVTYQWSRSSDGGSHFADIAGATGNTYALAGVNLGDDGAVFRVVATASNGIAHAVSHLAVSATPGLVFEDGEFQPADWLITPFGDANAPAPIATDERQTSGGNPGAFRKMVFRLPAFALAGRVFYTSLRATYDPPTQGAIYVIDYAEDGISLQENTSTSTESAMLLEQGGRIYIANVRSAGVDLLPTSWSAVESRSSLSPQDFNLFTGPACPTGESCPDFSALGRPMRFGYWRISSGVQGDSIAHGIDNWKVTVWRR